MKKIGSQLFNKIKCNDGMSILDIGCGYGRILTTAMKHGVKAKGITISPQQYKRCLQKGLDVEIMDYKEIPKEWNNSFDGIIANGSLEHFVQVQDALNGNQDKIYKHLFQICHRLIKPRGYFTTTAIHFNQEVNPQKIIKGSKKYSKNSDNAHFSKILLENLGGWYPYKNQLEKSAKGLFILDSREDGTDDYHLTSEYWLKSIKKAIVNNPKVWIAIIGKFLKSPRNAYGMLDTWLFSQSWMWQFRKKINGNTPTVLYRDVWKRID